MRTGFVMAATLIDCFKIKLKKGDVGTTKTIVVVKYVVFCLLCLRLCFGVKRKEKRRKDNLIFMVNIFLILVVLFLNIKQIFINKQQ